MFAVARVTCLLAVRELLLETGRHRRLQPKLVLTVWRVNVAVCIILCCNDEEQRNAGPVAKMSEIFVLSAREDLLHWICNAMHYVKNQLFLFPLQQDMKSRSLRPLGRRARTVYSLAHFGSSNHDLSFIKPS